MSVESNQRTANIDLQEMISDLIDKGLKEKDTLEAPCAQLYDYDVTETQINIIKDAFLCFCCAGSCWDN
ncbi:hypothetical protein D5018_20285 [Parashewanella curva]|uniref:Uncharacterized protein n=1 Tax=Parashewanella curva TaxID=2338552 RepID=A0A3L8PUZ9_9GAMM|nr:hypothetical protein [Parashewanella curva]RLV57862.1 hypothetical protein D5018_20285 [Parashewanella curva]